MGARTPAMVALGACLLLAIAPRPATAQYLAPGDLGISPPRTTLRELFANSGRPPNVRDARLVVEREFKGLEAAAQSGTLDDKDNFAVALIRLGRLDQAEARMRAILEAAPGRPRTLHNLAIMQIRASKFDQALVTLHDLDRAAPGYANDVAAGLRALVDFRRAQTLRADWSQRNLLSADLTKLWEQFRADPSKLPPPDRARSMLQNHQPPLQGWLEMIRRFPEFGDGWASLGFYFEVQGDAYNAWKCYRFAIQRGTGLRSVLDRHIRLIEAEAQKQNPARLVTPRAIATFAAIVVLGLAVAAWKFGRAALEDMREARLNREPKKGSYGPLGDKPLD